MGASLGTLAAAGFVGLGAAEPSAREFAIPAAMASVVGVPPIYWTALAVRRIRAIKKLKNQLRERIEQHLTDKYTQHLRRNPDTPIREDPTLRRLFEGFDPNTPSAASPETLLRTKSRRLQITASGQPGRSLNNSSMPHGRRESKWDLPDILIRASSSGMSTAKSGLPCCCWQAGLSPGCSCQQQHTHINKNHVDVSYDY